MFHNFISEANFKQLLLILSTFVLTVDGPYGWERCVFLILNENQPYTREAIFAIISVFTGSLQSFDDRIYYLLFLHLSVFTGSLQSFDDRANYVVVLIAPQVFLKVAMQEIRN